MIKEHEEVEISNATQVAFLSLKGLHVTPHVRSDGRVVFTVRGDASKFLAELQGNPLIPLLDYLQRLSTVRSIIYTMKNGNGKGYKRDGDPSV